MGFMLAYLKLLVVSLLELLGAVFILSLFRFL